MKEEKKNTKEKSTKSPGRKAVVQAIAKQDKENQKQSSKSSQEMQQAICLKAYELFLQRGEQHGSDVEDWLAAERIVLQNSR